MRQYDAKFGLMAGGSAILISLIIYMVDAEMYLMYGSILSGIPMIYFAVQAALTEKKLNRGIISFKDAFKNSWVTYLIYSVLTTIFAYVLFNFIDPELNEMLKETTIELIEKLRSIVGDEGTDKAIEAIEVSGAQTVANLGLNFLFSLIFPGACIAAIIALIVKKEENPWQEKDVL